MEMKPTTLFFEENDKAIIKNKASEVRESFSAYVRKSALLRAGVLSEKAVNEERQ